MNIAIISGLPCVFRSILQEIAGELGHVLDFIDIEALFYSIRRGAEFQFIILNAEQQENLEQVMHSVTLESPRAKLLFYGVQDTGLTIKLMRGGAELCFTDKLYPSQLKDYLLQAIVYEGSNINQNMHKHRWFVGESQAIRNLKKSLNDAISSNKNIIISGESGTGKANMARVIHESSSRRVYQFKSFDLSAFNQDYLENQFWIVFRNFFEEIDSDISGMKNPIYGTIFIEHVEEQFQDFISSLLNMIQQHYHKSLSQSGFLSSRIIIPWSTGLDKLSQYANLDDFFLLKLPSLMARKEDIPLLIYTLINKYSEKYGKVVKSISLDVFNLLISYDWPGNILELQSVLESAVLIADTDTLTMKDIGITMSMLFQVSKHNVLGTYVPLNVSLQKYQTALINAVLETSDYNYEQASLFLGLNKTELFNKMRILNIST